MRFTYFMMILSMMAFRAEAFDLKGVVVGKPATLSQIRAAFGARCDWGDACRTDIEGVTVKVRVYRDHGVVSMVHADFDSDEFETIEKAARAKYGKPTGSEEQQMQNAFGARFTDRMIYWDDAEGARVMMFKTFDHSWIKVDSAATVKADRKPKSKM